MLPFKKDIRFVRSLQQKKFRTEFGLFVAEGKKMVEEALSSTCKVQGVYTTDREYLTSHTQCYLVSGKEMEQLSSLSQPPGYLAVIEVKKNSALSGKSCVLVLDGISDPGNMGTIIRSAEWFGITDIVCSEDCVDIYNPKVVQATMGSIFRVNCITENFIVLLNTMRNNGFSLIGADLSGKNIYLEPMKEPIALIIGSESRGIRPEVRSLLTDLVHIPGMGKTESLNASVAASILLSEFYRKSKYC
ncbi:MAG: RNA methyltransferase [Crocinitomicaceae bacterium]|nr:RNA methyltransferase [Crocinitomicaceae bacterium]